MKNNASAVKAATKLLVSIPAVIAAVAQSPGVNVTALAAQFGADEKKFERVIKLATVFTLNDHAVNLDPAAQASPDATVLDNSTAVADRAAKVEAVKAALADSMAKAVSRGAKVLTSYDKLRSRYDRLAKAAGSTADFDTACSALVAAAAETATAPAAETAAAPAA